MSKNFSEVFHELVPQGHGQLVMKKATEEVAQLSVHVLHTLYWSYVQVHDLSMSDSQGSSAGPTPNSNEFTGISIRVCSLFLSPPFTFILFSLSFLSFSSYQKGFIYGPVFRDEGATAVIWWSEVTGSTSPHICYPEV